MDGIQIVGEMALVDRLAVLDRVDIVDNVTAGRVGECNRLMEWQCVKSKPNADG